MSRPNTELIRLFMKSNMLFHQRWLYYLHCWITAAVTARKPFSYIFSRWTLCFLTAGCLCKRMQSQSLAINAFSRYHFYHLVRCYNLKFVVVVASNKALSGTSYSGKTPQSRASLH